MEQKKLIEISDTQIEAIYDSGKANTVAFIRTLVDKINEIDQIVKEQQIEINKLKAIIVKNSRNSSKPPSTDGFKDKPNPKSQRKQTGKKVGGQKGHKGFNLRQSDNPDKIVLNKVMKCSHCQKNLRNRKLLKIEKRQVVNITINTTYTEYQSEQKKCSCGSITKADFPKGLNSPIQYGESVKSICNYLSTYQLLPYKRLQELFCDIFELPISPGTLVNMNMELGSVLKQEWEDKLKQQLLTKKVLHFDETGFRLFGKRYWLHSTSSKNLTLYQFHKKRGSIAMDEIGILPIYQGIAVHDFWKSYFKYDSIFHVLCNAHHIRELTFLHEQLHQYWAKEMIDLLIEIKEKRDMIMMSEKCFSSVDLKKFNDKYDEILKIGFTANPIKILPTLPKKRGRPKKGKVINLLDRFRNHKESILAFMNDWDIPFDNNQAERDIRMMKVQQKISGTFRSERCIEMFCRIRSYISTAKKNDHNILKSIVDALQGAPYIPRIIPE